ncbi:MAG: 1-acyl-sn-glycerol-3-phosphate acyltransferase [Clostridia bacterium]|nr:1-acyl-sn-glycerol-3-phosphate acyltransferase [Clostridia bacterium]
MEQSKYRLEVLDKIKELEKEGRFDVDADENPSFEPLKAGEVDYLRKKLSSKIKNVYCNHLLDKFVKSQVKANQGFLDNIVGMEKLYNLKGGAMITSNHFHPFDSWPISTMVKCLRPKRKMHIIIAEHNYAGAEGFNGKIFRNTNTIPLAQDRKVMMECMRAINHFLHKGDWILIYPEQAMWWNYRKPRPLKSGAFRFAVKSNKPVVACFITMRDTEYMDREGFPVQAYTLHILDVLYPKSDLSEKENVEYLKQENERLMKEKYEEVYGIPLSYTNEEE